MKIMPDFENLKLTLENHILILTINRPDSLNALNIKTVNELKDAIREAKNPMGRGVRT